MVIFHRFLYVDQRVYRGPFPAYHLGSGAAVQAIRRQHLGHTDLLRHGRCGAHGPGRGTAVDRGHWRRAAARQLLQDVPGSEAGLLVAW